MSRIEEIWETSISTGSSRVNLRPQNNYYQGGQKRAPMLRIGMNVKKRGAVKAIACIHVIHPPMH